MSDEVEPKKIRHYGYIPDLPDQRDRKYQLPKALEKADLPESYDMSKDCPPIVDQGDLGSCTANAGVAAYQFTAMEQKKRTSKLSRLYLYYNTRILENTVDWDSGASIRNTIKSLNKWGVCLESAWPYKPTKFAKKPPASCYEYGASKILRSYARVSQTANDLKACLAQNNPILFGFSVYQSFEEDEIARTGIMKLPSSSERVLGGHAVMMIGYDNKREAFLVRNSWGPDWGLNGNFWMPYSFALDPNMADDFWTVISVP